MLETRDIRAYIDKHRTRRQSNKVLHGHPSPGFWNDRDVQVTEVMRQRAESSATAPKRLNLYVGTPYCLPTEPDRCGFCLFPSEVYKDRRQLDVYLTYLRKEGELFRRHLEGVELASIYFGGGTSNLYNADQYAELMSVVGEVFEIPPQIEVTLEGIPQTFTHDKLAAMKACGINRISMGVQQVDDELIKASGRRQKSSQVFRTIASCQEFGLPISVDLIFGWPNQTVDHMLRDLAAVVATGISHITHYELNVAGRTDFSRRRRDALPSIEQNLEMYRLGKEFLESKGYHQVTPYDFERPSDTHDSSYLYEELFRRPLRAERGQLLGFDAWGWGYAGISFFFGAPTSPGWAYINQIHIDDYYRDLDKGHYPVMRGFRYSEADLRLHLLFQELQGLSIDRTEHAAIFGRDVVQDFQPIWDVLEERGWARVNNVEVSITGDGVFHLPLVQNLLARERTEDMRRQRKMAETGLGPLAGVASGIVPETGRPPASAPAARVL
jgi:oxygen-independent coproporphyrinogen-3 oxidase